MVTICSGFLDLCIPLNVFDKNQPNQPNQLDQSEQAMKSQHEMYWEKRCNKFPSEPGCKVYDD